jgi:hypothetical protein
MSMSRLSTGILALAFSSCSAASSGMTQGSGVTAGASAASHDIQSWLAGDDPRLMAWGGYLSIGNGDSSSDAAMVEILDEWAEPAGEREDLSAEQLDAFTAILDALIQRNKTVSPETLAALAEKFPSQAAILAARLSIDESLPLLQSWYAMRKDDKSGTLARIAAMMLSKAPPPGFPASVLEDTREIVQVTIVDLGAGFGTGFGGGYFVDRGTPRRQGWPPIFRYSLVENPQEGRDPLLVEAGGDRIIYQRTLESPAASVRPLDDETRQHLLLDMLGGDRSALRWETRPQISVEWQGSSSFLADLGSIVDGEEAKLRDTVEAFYESGLLTPEEASKARPALSVNIFDYRSRKDTPIPKFDSRDPRTTVTFAFQVD